MIELDGHLDREDSHFAVIIIAKGLLVFSRDEIANAIKRGRAYKVTRAMSARMEKLQALEKVEKMRKSS
jgi:hypothetical protein